MSDFYNDYTTQREFNAERQAAATAGTILKATERENYERYKGIYATGSDDTIDNYSTAIGFNIFAYDGNDSISHLRRQTEAELR